MFRRDHPGLSASHKPVLVAAYPGISGGVFDHGITDEGVLHLNLTQATWFEKPEFQQPFAEWLGRRGMIATCPVRFNCPRN